MGGCLSRESGPGAGPGAAGASPLRLVRSLQDVQSLGAMPVVILEPWEHVGHNVHGEEVRASHNVAHVVATGLGLSCACVPLWELACPMPAEDLARALEGRALVLEGGAPDVYDPSTYTHPACPRSYLFDLYKLLLRRRAKMGPCVFICLSHQMAAACLVELVKDAVRELALMEGQGATLAEEIAAVGREVRVMKKDGVVAVGFQEEKFATARNEMVEAALLQLHAFDRPAQRSGPGADEFAACVEAHGISAGKRDGKIETMMKEESDGLFIAMFHGVEVNVEGVLFANWALGKLKGACGILPWLGELPSAVEIVASTRRKDTNAVVTDVASMRIDYENDGTDTQSFYTCQFHPELCGELRDARVLAPKPYGVEDGSRLLAGVLNSASPLPMK